MKDLLKKFITENRQAFDNREPSDRVWRGIEPHLPAGGTSWWNKVVLWRAAAILFLGISSYLFFTNRPASADRQALGLLGEFAYLENFYNEQITEKVELISKINEWDADEDFTPDIQKLDAMYQVLREQMKINPSEKVKDALILNMLVRIDLLNQQIHKL
jgi:hypothetical protein